MNVREYIDSGVLYDYCTNALSESERQAVEEVCTQYPEIKEELLSLQQSLNGHAEKTAVWPKAELQESIWSTLENINIEKNGDLNNLPLINKYSDHNNWKRIVMPLVPETVIQDREIKMLRETSSITQMLVISKTNVDEEIHENEKESFLVLEGECECCIGAEVTRLGPGGFIEIPLHTRHNVKVLSPYVVAVLQHVAI